MMPRPPGPECLGQRRSEHAVIVPAQGEPCANPGLAQLRGHADIRPRRRLCASTAGPRQEARTGPVPGRLFPVGPGVNAEPSGLLHGGSRRPKASSGGFFTGWAEGGFRAELPRDSLDRFPLLLFLSSASLPRPTLRPLPLPPGVAGVAESFPPDPHSGPPTQLTSLLLLADSFWLCNSLETDSDLPAGWMRVQDTSGSYYWHIPTGTTQWEPPLCRGRGDSAGNTPTRETQVKGWGGLAPFLPQGSLRRSPGARQAPGLGRPAG